MICRERTLKVAAGIATNSKSQFVIEVILALDVRILFQTIGSTRPITSESKWGRLKVMEVSDYMRFEASQ